MERNDELRRLKNRINWFCENKINAFSPTISPAPKSEERNEIESIEEAIRYFVNQGIEELIVQKKYMGSYCDIYLHKNIEETYFVSRNGHKINHIDLDKAIEACKGIHSKLDWNNLKLVIIQAELMPWSVLGKGLIENEFEGYLCAHKIHYEQLQHSDLYQKIEKVKQSQAYQDFITFKKTHKQKEVAQEYPAHIVRQYSSLEDFTIKDMEKYKQGIDIYTEQIAHFGKTGEIYFKPFNILKKVFEDDTELLVNDNLSYQEINEDEFLQLRITSGEEQAEAIEQVYNWFKTLGNENEEGIVIKPRKAFEKGIPPAFKVRNDYYLTMIYGINFLEEYEYNVRKRKIEKKLECSVNDWMINWKLLQIPYSEINTENYYLKNLVYDRIMGEKVEMTLDTRL